MKNSLKANVVYAKNETGDDEQFYSQTRKLEIANQTSNLKGVHM